MEFRECEHCCECLYYSSCKRNKEVSEVVAENMTCYGDECIMTSCVCCEFFESRKSIDDIYEEQKKTEPAYEPDNYSLSIADIEEILSDGELPF